MSAFGQRAVRWRGSGGGLLVRSTFRHSEGPPLDRQIRRHLPAVAREVESGRSCALDDRLVHPPHKSDHVSPHPVEASQLDVDRF